MRQSSTTSKSTATNTHGVIGRMLCNCFPFLAFNLYDKLHLGLNSRSSDNTADIHLPEDIIIHILVRLPARSVVRFWSVCRQWYSITSTQSFAMMNHQYGPDTPVHLLQVWEHSIGNSTVDSELVFMVERAAKRVKKVRYNPYLQSYNASFHSPKLIFSHKGLLMLVHKFGNARFLVLYNPLTEEQVIVNSPPKKYKECGFYFHLPTEEVRVLYQVCKHGKVIAYAILGLRTKSLRLIKKSSHHPHTLLPPTICNGALHWIVTGTHTGRGYGIIQNCSETILSFGMEDEKFRVLPHPGPECPDWRKNIVHDIDLLEIDGKLCYCFVQDNTLDLWVVEDYSKWTWVKKYAVKITKIIRNSSFSGRLVNSPFSGRGIEDYFIFRIMYVHKGHELLCLGSLKSSDTSNKFACLASCNVHESTWRVLDVACGSHITGGNHTDSLLRMGRRHNDILISSESNSSIFSLHDGQLSEYDCKEMRWSILAQHH